MISPAPDLAVRRESDRSGEGSTMKRRDGIVASALLALLVFAGAAQAARGACSQPSTTGSGPSASDCLFILRTAVGSLTCGPACICAPKGSLPTVSSDALLCLRGSVGQPVVLDCPCDVPIADDFNDNSKDAARWGDDTGFGNGVLTETSQRVQFTISSGTDFDLERRPWVGSILPYSSDWIVQLDVVDTTTPTQNDELNAVGLALIEEGNDGNEIFLELYSSDNAAARTGFNSGLFEEYDDIQFIDTAPMTVTSGTLRMEFESSTKVVTLYYDATLAGEQAWVRLGSYGVAGGGGDANADWTMTNASAFVINLQGYSQNMNISPGQAHSDNFALAGGIEP
jgi:hypothetical protein